jgi:hypothetical protein
MFCKACAATAVPATLEIETPYNMPFDAGAP